MTNQLKTVVALFDDVNSAASAVRSLNQAGIPSGDVNLVAHASANQVERYFDQNGHYAAPAAAADTNATGDVATGAMWGGVAGLLAGLAMITVPGLGPVIAAGPLAVALGATGVGAVLGGLLGGLTSLGVPDDHAGLYAEGVRRGGSLVVVKTDAAHEQAASSTLREHSPVDITERSARWKESGWSGYDAKAPAYTYDEALNERKTFSRL